MVVRAQPRAEYEEAVMFESTWRITRRGFIGAMLTLVVLGPRLGFADTARAGTWAPTGSLNIARAAQTATLLQDGRVLAVGGVDSSGIALGSAEIFDPATNQWTQAEQGSLYPRSYHTATLLSNGQVLVVGADKSSTRSAQLYDPSTGHWLNTGGLIIDRYEHTATLLPNGKVLIAGGNDQNGDPLASAELYDPVTGQFTTTGSLAIARADHTATLLPNGQVLVAGGDILGGTPLTTELYDPSTGTWTTTGSLNSGRTGHTATLLPNGKVLVAGGYNSQTNTMLASAELYDPSTGLWTPTGSMVQARGGATATLLGNGQVLMAGGANDTGQLAAAECYDPNMGTWTPTGSMATARDLHTATLLASGQVLVAGGVSGPGQVTNSAELYTPGAPAQLAASPGTAYVTQKFGLSGSRFASSEPLAFALDGATLPLTATSGLTGTLAATLTVPEAAYGPHLLSAVGLSSALVATTTLQVRPALALGAYSGSAGSTDTAVGTGFGADEPVALHWNAPNGPTLGTTTSSGKGSFYGATTIGFRVPAGYRGWHRLYGVGTHSGAVAASAFYER